MMQWLRHNGPRILAVLADVCKILGTIVVVIIDWTRN
jgi:hypothetical protein